MTMALIGETTPNPISLGNLTPPWQPGQSGNPAGRPRGARHKLGGDFLEALLEDFHSSDEEGKINGIEAIRKARSDEPTQYVKSLIAILPKELEAGERLSNILEDILARVDGRTRTVEPLRLTKAE